MNNSRYSEIARLKEYEEKISNIRKEIKEIENSLSETSKKSSLVKLAKLYKINYRKSPLVETLNAALKDIFFDKDISIEVQIESKDASIRYDFVLYKNGIEIARNADIYNTNGGGAISVISWVLKFIMSYLNETGNLLIFDESFSQVSNEYLDNLSEFIRKVSETYDVHILFITHSNLQTHAHLTYYFSGTVDDKNVDTLILDRVDINIDNVNSIDEIDSNYYKVHIENFQSISNLDLVIKGFTCIRGKSDIGKTAIIRAINSIINNDYQPKFKRFKVRKPAIIKLQYIDSEKESKEISLEAKSDGVYYILPDGTKLKGKSLAAERIEDALEKFGFKRIDLATYASWNSELKKQTQRINVTTQHDKLYFSNERNATEKILSILFDSNRFNEIHSYYNEIERNLKSGLQLAYSKLQEYVVEFKKIQLNIFNIILNVFEEINSYRGRKNELNEVKQELQNELEDIRYKHEVIVSNHNILLKIHSVENEKLTINELKSKMAEFHQEHFKLSRLNEIQPKILILSKISDFQIAKQKNASMHRTQQMLRRTINNIKVCEFYYAVQEYQRAIRVVEKFTSTRKKYAHSIKVFNQAITQYNLYKKLNEYFTIFIQIQRLNNTKSTLLNEMNQISKNENIELCPTCNGLGYISKER